MRRQKREVKREPERKGGGVKERKRERERQT